MKNIRIRFQIDEMFRKEMHEKMGGREDLKRALTPKFRYGCKRITPHDHYISSELQWRRRDRSLVIPFLQ